MASAMQGMRGLMPQYRSDWRGWALSAAALLALLAAVMPHLPARGEAFWLIAVVDVTGSMNVRDQETGGAAQSRLSAVKATLRALATELPCGSRLGLGIFTERRSFLLFEPVDTCADFAALDGAIAALDWRMAWEGDSYVARGLYSAIDLAAPLKADLIFFTDGQEAPPLPQSGIPPFSGEAGKVGGLIIGVGGPIAVPIPRFDAFGRESGFFGPTDVPQENRHGPPPENAEARPGWHPRNAPWGAEVAGGEEHLSAVRTDHLQALAARTGLIYLPLQPSAALVPALAQAAHPHAVTRATSIARLPAALALLLVAGVYALPLISSFRQNRTARP